MCPIWRPEWREPESAWSADFAGTEIPQWLPGPGFLIVSKRHQTWTLLRPLPIQRELCIPHPREKNVLTMPVQHTRHSPFSAHYFPVPDKSTDKMHGARPQMNYW